MKPKKLYIGIDPDLRKLSAAIVSEDKKPYAVFLPGIRGRGTTKP